MILFLFIPISDYSIVRARAIYVDDYGISVYKYKYINIYMCVYRKYAYWVNIDNVCIQLPRINIVSEEKWTR